MEDIQRTVKTIVDRCTEKGIEDVSPALAAMVARSVVLEDVETFRLDKVMTENDSLALVDATVRRLAEKHSPQLLTMRMQIDFDRVYFETQEKLHKKNVNQNVRMNSLRSNIVGIEKSQGSDFRVVNEIYREVFNYLVAYAGADTKKNKDVEREIAAALESVFPKIGLKSFNVMEPDDQRKQLIELASIITGIRLFNRHVGKGGAGIINTHEECQKSATALLEQLEEKRNALEALCEEYSVTIVYAHRQRDGEGPESSKVSRWQTELANRQQFLAYIRSLEHDTNKSLEQMDVLENTMNDTMKTLQELVGGRSSVPKEKVYPQFDIAAGIFADQEKELNVVKSRHQIWEQLLTHLNAVQLTLEDKWVELALEDSESESKVELEEKSYEESKSRSRDEESKSSVEEKDSEPPQMSSSKDGVILLGPESSINLLTLPMEFQGFCPWTAAKRNGLLLPGNPKFGVVQFNNTYTVFQNEQALKEFMRNPQLIIDQLVAIARLRPDLIRLMELSKYFPASTADYLSNLADSGHKRASLIVERKMIDAGTETPLHFVEKHIDPNYEWNEWALRRKALQLTNLRKAKTSSAQTTKSHFRRDNETQVYLPKAQGTQTGVNKGTNPPRKHQYIAGLRGLQTSRFVRYESNDVEESRGSKYTKSRATVIQMNFEL